MKIRKIVLIEPRPDIVHEFSLAKLPRLGLPLLGKILKRKEKKVTIFCEEIKEINWKEVFGADLVGISSLTNTINRAYKIAKKIKAKTNIPVVMGGPHVTFRPEEALKNSVDYVVRKEGEETFPKLIEALEQNKNLNKILGISYYNSREEKINHNPDRPLIKNLDQNPHPDLTLIKGWEKMRIIPVQTTRGCPYNCDFCQVVEMFGHKYRKRSIKDVIEELKRYKYLNKPVFFYDDNFASSKKRAKELSQKLKEEKDIKIPRWSTQVRISSGRDKELVKKMRESGCNIIYAGIESINQKSLDYINKKQNIEEIEEGVNAFKEEKINIHGMFIFGTKLDTKETIKKTVNWAKKNIDTAQFLALTPIPGTRIYKKLKKQGKIWANKIEDWKYYDGHHVVFRPETIKVKKLQEIIMKANKEFYSIPR
ncbi:MAG: B12-binding domain-containing radical SAM protein, partial [Minisyncoccales bacterium]